VPLLIHRELAAHIVLNVPHTIGIAKREEREQVPHFLLRRNGLGPWVKDPGKGLWSVVEVSQEHSRWGGRAPKHRQRDRRENKSRD